MTTTASSKEENQPEHRRRRFQRAAKPPHPFTALQAEVLRLVAESKFLATPQVAALMGVSPKAARDHLRALFDSGLVDILPVPGAAVGTKALIAANVYLPTKEGLRTLDRLDTLPAHADKPASYDPARYRFLGHELAVRDVLVWLTRSARLHAGEEHAVTRWDCSSGLLAETDAGAVRPDAVFVYDFGGRGVAGLVEADMGTERGVAADRSDRWAAKLAAYGRLLEQEDREPLRALTGTTRARIVVSVPSEARAQWVARRAWGTPAERFVWIALRSEMENAAAADVHAPCLWRRPDGSRPPFVPPNLSTGGS
jgi:DNA-binding CsgD family transcriptional regulator